MQIKPVDFETNVEARLLKNGQLVPVVGVVETVTKEDLHRATLEVLGKTMSQKEKIAYLDQEIRIEQKKVDLADLKKGRQTMSRRTKLLLLTAAVTVAAVVAKSCGVSLPL